MPVRVINRNKLKLQKTIINDNIGWDKTLWVQPILKLNLTERWKMTYAGQIDMIENQIIRGTHGGGSGWDL